MEKMDPDDDVLIGLYQIEHLPTIEHCFHCDQRVFDSFHITIIIIENGTCL